jgi:hypothetical protein
MCTRFCDHLSEVLIRLTEEAATETKAPQDKPKKPSRLVVCLITMGLFCKVSPEFMLKHAENLETYLKNKVSFLCVVSAHVLTTATER